MNFRSLQRPTDAQLMPTPVGPRDRRGRALRRWLSVLAALGVAACSDSDPQGSTPDPTPTPEAAAPPGQHFTASDTALTNLSSRIGGLRAAVAAQPSVTALRAELVSNLLTRAQFVGSFQDLGESLSLAAEGRGSSA